MSLRKLARAVRIVSVFGLGLSLACQNIGHTKDYTGTNPDDGGEGVYVYRWTNGSNWTGGQRPTATEQVIFKDLGVAGTDPYTISASTTERTSIANGMTFNGTSALNSYTIGLNSNEKVSIGGANGFITSSSPANHTINATIKFSGTGNANISTTGTGTLRFNGGVERTGQALGINSGSDIHFASTLNAGDIALTGTGSTTSTVHFDGTLTSTTLNVSNVRAEFGPTASVDVSGTVTIGPGGILSGKAATFQGNTIIAANGMLVGDAPGATLNFEQQLAFEANSKFSWTLDHIGGPISVDSLSFGDGFVTDLNVSGVFDLSSLDLGGSWVVFTGLESNLTGDPALAEFNLLGDLNGLDASRFSWLANSALGTVSINVAAVPEPSTLALLGVAGAISSVVARRRAKRNKLSQDTDTNLVVA